MDARGVISRISHDKKSWGWERKEGKEKGGDGKGKKGRRRGGGWEGIEGKEKGGDR